jgi:hypothetical protein
MFSEEETISLGAALHEVIAAMLGRDLRDGELPYHETVCPFDIDRQNFHENKTEFKAELSLIRNWLGQFEVMTGALHRDTSAKPDQEDMHDLVEYLDGWARRNSKYIEPETIQEMAVNNVMRVGIVSCVLMLNEQLKGLLEDRLSELEEQEKHYWSVDHRPPNYYARTIALRLAKLFARETGKFPTIGTTSDGSTPSTAYARALEETFQILSIGQDVRGPGEWAVSQITEGDLEPRSYVSSVSILKTIAATGYLRKKMPFPKT